MAVAFSGGSQTDLPYLEIDTGTNRKLFRENPDWVRKAEWIGGGNDLDQKALLIKNTTLNTRFKDTV